MIRLFLASAVGLGLCLSAPVTAEDWPQFRGPSGSGATKGENLPTERSQEKLFKDESVLLPDNLIKIDDNKNIRIETRDCDYALAICVKLSGQSYADYGFGILGSQSDKDASVYSGFTNDETRKAAFKKYAEWRKANLITKD